MDYEKKYNEALERAEAIYTGKYKPEIAAFAKKSLETIFPELAESEDEKIRKEIITNCRNTRCVTEEGAEKIAKWIAWLEKQGKKPQGKSALEVAKEEKIEDGNKIESKFHEGDWIIHRGTENVYQVVACIDNQYQLRYGDNYTIQKCDEVDRNARLWTIQDAKPSDVLAAHECYVIFKEIDGLNIKCYCTYHYMNNPSFHVDTLHNKDAFHPATKEQRELLFKAIEENGYKWNDEEKHLLEEADLEEEIEKYLLTNTTLLLEGSSKLVVHHIAKHFFELGLKVQKGGKE